MTTEYIGQLEGELAAKAAEADRYRMRSEQLTAENTRLTDLTRMLLSSPHFSTFLDELSANRGSLSSFTQAASQPNLGQQQQRPTQLPKDANPISHQSNLHIGLATIPETSYENSMAPTSTNGWTPNAAFDQRVFAVTDIPAEPVIDTRALSGKSDIDASSSFRTKNEAPEITSLQESKSYQSPIAQTPSCVEYLVDEDVDFNESDSAFTLFSDTSVPSRETPNSCVAITSEQISVGNLLDEKPQGRSDITIQTRTGLSDSDMGESVMCKLDRMRTQMDSIGARIHHLCGGL